MKSEARSELICGVLRSVHRSLSTPVVWFVTGEYGAELRRGLGELHAAARDAGAWGRLRALLAAGQRLHARAQADLAALDLRALAEPQLRQLFRDAVERSCRALREWRGVLGAFLDDLKDCMPPADLAELKKELNFTQVILDASCDVRQKEIDFKRNVPVLDHISRIQMQLEATQEWFRTLFRNTCMQFCKALFLEIVDSLNENMQATIKDASAQEALADVVHNKISCCHSLCRLFFVNTDCLNKPRIVMQIHTLRGNITDLEKEIQLLQKKSNEPDNFNQVLQDIMTLRESLRTLELLCPKKLKISSQFEPNEDSLFARIQLIWQEFESGTVDKARVSLISARSNYRDHLGEYYIDKYGRKIYETEEEIYQVDQHKRLVPLQDDDRVYFYDKHGRYYTDKDKVRVYKRSSDASEYKLQLSGKMIKVKEYADKKDTFFEQFGRYYFQSEDRTRRDEGAADGGSAGLSLGREDFEYVECPQRTGPMVLKESQYLKRCVGEALKTCLVKTILMQPEHPIMWLADELENYKRVVDMREWKKEDDAARKQHMEDMHEDVAGAPSRGDDTSGGSEAYSLDTNLVHYEGLTLDD